MRTDRSRTANKITGFQTRQQTRTGFEWGEPLGRVVVLPVTRYCLDGATAGEGIAKTRTDLNQCRIFLEIINSVFDRDSSVEQHRQAVTVSVIKKIFCVRLLDG